MGSSEAAWENLGCSEFFENRLQVVLTDERSSQQNSGTANIVVYVGMRVYVKNWMTRTTLYDREEIRAPEV